ncbi:MAG: hypothetical protein CMC81_07050 [Flavobacteriaceae bacterium]|nr:hypothetical protein [Flavobacteriaceae bacterium]
MKSSEIFKEIIQINKIISDNKLQDIRPRTPEMTEGYNKIAKPLLDKFKNKHGQSTSGYIKSIIDKSLNVKSNSNLKSRAFGNWGIKVNDYIWASLYVDNDNEMPASHSIQLYILAGNDGIKFGFDYGVEVTNDHQIVSAVRNNEELQISILNAINEFGIYSMEIEAGSPVTIYDYNTDENVIKKIEDFKNWNNKIHLIKSYKSNEIPYNIEEEITNVIDSLINVMSMDLFDDKYESKGYWLYAAGRNAADWKNQYDNGFMSIGFDINDDLGKIKTKEELEELVENTTDGSYNTSKALWDFSKEIDIGDVIISKKGRSKYLGYGIVTSEYKFDLTLNEHKHIRNVNWLKSGEWKSVGKLPVKTLTNISQYPDYVERIKHLLEIKDKIEVENKVSEFNLDRLISDVFIDKNEFENIVDILKAKKNIILQGPAGVGKTFIAKKIAQGLKEEISDNNIEVIQFHQSYSYEDFIQGYRPNKESFELKNGIFYELCQKAIKDITSPYFLVIDEINRGNLSKIFGELMMLIEFDKRGEKNKIKLTYSDSDDYFFIPENLYVIGTMNTADRSLTIVDYALRRRFAFIKMIPKYNTKFVDFLGAKGVSKGMIKNITDKMKALNTEIREDESLGDGFEIGHSYFCGFKKAIMKENKWFESILNYEIIPMLNEYWFDDPEKVEELTSMITN